MQILLWLVPAVVVTLGAMAVAGWVGRERPEVDRASQAAQERFAKAISREHPAVGATRPRPVRDRSTGIAVRAQRPPIPPAVVETTDTAPREVPSEIKAAPGSAPQHTDSDQRRSA